MNKYLKRIFLFITFLSCIHLHAQTTRDYNMAMIHYCDHDYSKSLKEFLSLADYGELNVQFNLAQHYLYGLGTDKDMSKALMYLKRASDKSCALSQALTVSVLNELEKQDCYDYYKYARMFCTNCQTLDYTDSDTNCAFYAMYECYHNGWGVKKNEELARIWLAYAAYQDSMLAQHEFEKIYNVSLEYNSYDEETQMLAICYRQFYENITSACGNYIDFDDSTDLQIQIVKLYNSFSSCQIFDAVSISENILQNCNPEDALRKRILSFLAEYSHFFPNNEKFLKYTEEYKNYANIDDKEAERSLDKIFAKFMLRVDNLLSPVESMIGYCNKHEWVNLGLPSGNKWATYNLGSNNKSKLGVLLSWGETTPKRKYESSSYKGDLNTYLLGKEDPACLKFGNGWSTPTPEDWFELIDYCDVYFTDEPQLLHFVGPNKQELSIPIGDDDTVYWTCTKTYDYNDIDKERALCFVLDGLYTAPVWSSGLIRPVLKE